MNLCNGNLETEFESKVDLAVSHFSAAIFEPALMGRLEHTAFSLIGLFSDRESSGEWAQRPPSSKLQAEAAPKLPKLTVEFIEC